MSYITKEGVNAWADGSKLSLTVLDGELETSVASQVLARVSQAYDVSSWTDSSNTPQLIKSVMAMMYMGYYYQRVYSEDTQLNNYGIYLIERAEKMLDNIVTGVVDIGVIPIGGADTMTASSFPNDLSSANEPTMDNPSFGGPKFTMGQIW